MSYPQLVLLAVIAAFLVLLLTSLICDTVKEVARIRAGIPTEQKKRE